MNTKSPECWASDPNARGVRIEVSAESSLLLPFDQFAFAELTHEAKAERLRMVFATHEVLIRGTCLRRIETAMQREQLCLLGKVPSSHRSLIPEGQPMVVEIVVIAISPQAIHSDGLSESVNGSQQMNKERESSNGTVH